MKTVDVSKRFLSHFARYGHEIVPGVPLPFDDPNLLLVNSGMVQFVPYYSGDVEAPWVRVASVQKCIRTVDIEEVGKTTRHGTFFQMAGNFCFGDYFREEAIAMAWELVTSPVEQGGYGLDPDRIWPTVFETDEEAFDLWHRKIGIPRERIQRRGMADNLWSMGIPGPCGPSSELFYDRGPAYGREGGPAVNEDRYMEFWNLVFMNSVRGPGTSKTDYEIVGALPHNNIDTGMGLERMAALLQGVESLYETDEVRPILDRADELTGRRRSRTRDDRAAHSPHPDDVRLRVIADHVRTGLVLIGDGVTPSNDGRGYVLRRILRRAIRQIRLLGFEEPAFPHLFPVARQCMEASYPELSADFDRIAQYAYAEEETFLTTLRQGTVILDMAIDETKRAGLRALPGNKAFALHDTYGFPIDLTLEVAAEQGISVDEKEFRRLMGEQRRRAKADAASRKSGHADLSVYRQALRHRGGTEFTGHMELAREATIRALIGRDGEVPEVGEGDEIEVVLDATPFYAEGGGQQPDTGRITSDSGELEVVDVQQPVPGLIVHRAKVVRGEVRAGRTGFAEIDVSRRQAISRSHTATHLVHQTMRNVLGESATQAGSLNAPGRLRFDFNVAGAVPTSLMADVERQVNEVLLADLKVRAFVTSLEEARRTGAVALFGEKYGDQVRVVEVGDYARELCGGTHVTRSAQLGLVKLVSESSLGSGVRRVDALVGLDGFMFLAKEHLLVSRLAELFRVQPDLVVERVEQTVAQLRAAEKELEELRTQMLLTQAETLAVGVRDVVGVGYVAAEAPQGTSSNDARVLAMEIRRKLDPDRPGVVAVATRGSSKVSLAVAVDGRARDLGVSARDLVKQALSGRGGGNDELAQGGGLPADQVPVALARLEQCLVEQMRGRP